MLATVTSMPPRKSRPQGPTGRQVAVNVRRLRQRSGLTRKELAAKTGGLLSVDAVQKIENGAADPSEGRVVRQVNSDELTALAVALGVTPNALLLPPTVKGEAEVTGVGRLSARDAWRWARGRNRLPLEMKFRITADDDEDDDAWDRVEQAKDLAFRQENAPDDPPSTLPDMSPEQMKAALAVVEAVKDAQKLGLQPKAITAYARRVAFQERLQQLAEQEQEKRRARMTSEERAREEEERQAAKRAAEQIRREELLDSEEGE